MNFGDIAEFFTARFRGREAERVAIRTREYIERRSQQARILLANAVYHEAYQDELENVIVTLLALDMSDPQNHARAIALLNTAQGLRQVASRLHAYAREPEAVEAFRRRRDPIANNRS